MSKTIFEHILAQMPTHHCRHCHTPTGEYPNLEGLLPRCTCGSREYSLIPRTARTYMALAHWQMEEDFLAAELASGKPEREPNGVYEWYSIYGRP